MGTGAVLLMVAEGLLVNIWPARILEVLADMLMTASPTCRQPRCRHDADVLQLAGFGPDVLCHTVGTP